MNAIPWRSSVGTGLVYGALWGGAEALVHALRPMAPVWSATGVWLPVDAVGLAAVPLQAAWRYGLFCAALVPLLVALGGPLLDRAPGRPAAAPRAVLTLALFLNLYWWTKHTEWSWLRFHAGLPFHHPARLALSAGYLAACLLIARGLAGPGRLAAPGRRMVLAVLSVLLLGGGLSEWREARLVAFAGRPAPVDDPPNVLLVVVDALRADRLGCYGHERDPPISPNVDGLAGQGVVFERAYVQAPFTWTSFGSFLTGKYPRHHGLMRMAADQRLDPAANRTIARALADEGYVTGAFLTGTLSNGSGLLDGFDTYFETIVGHEPVTRASKWSIVRSELLLSVFRNKIRQKLDVRLVNTEAMDWIERQRDRPFFCMVHYYSTHTPYAPPAPYDRLYDPDYEGAFHPFTESHNKAVLDGRLAFDEERDLRHVKALYDGGVAFADDMFGDLLDTLDRLGLGDRTLVIFTSDHGEELYEHGVFEHDWMFETNLLVPLVMRLPGGAHAGARVSWPVEARDLPATIADMVGRGRLDPGGGRSLLPDAAGTPPPPEERAVFAENNRYVAVVEDRLKIIASRDWLARRPGSAPPRAFDLAADPGEHAPLPADLLAAPLLERLAAYDASMPSLESLPTWDEDPALFERLETLGYTDGMLGPNKRREEDLPARRAGEGRGGGGTEGDAPSGDGGRR